MVCTREMKLNPVYLVIFFNADVDVEQNNVNNVVICILGNVYEGCFVTLCCPLAFSSPYKGCYLCLGNNKEKQTFIIENSFIVFKMFTVMIHTLLHTFEPFPHNFFKYD